MISVDQWESHDVILNGKMRQLSWINNEGQRSVIVGIKWGVSSRFISSPKTTRENTKGCNLYAYLAPNVNGLEEGLYDLPVVRELRT
jgi:hypothetical protein